MQELKAKPFVNAVRALAQLEDALRRQDAEKLKATTESFPAVTKVMTAALKEFSDACVGLGADVSRMAAQELLSHFLNNGERLTLAVVHEEVRHLHKYFERHLESAKVFALNPDDARFYDGATAMFGGAVLNAFSTASPEIDEAGKCLALGRVAATLYHLMRVIEVGLRSLAPPLGITDPNPSWNTVIRKIDKEIKLEPKDRKLTADYAFLESVSAQMHAVNRAWRTRAMHVDTTFSLENARDIFSATKSLMQHLAIQLSEPSSASAAQPS